MTSTRPPDVTAPDATARDVAATDATAAEPPIASRALALHPQVALRPEPFGALAYHYDTRRLVFLKHPDVVRVVTALAEHPTVAATLATCGIERRRWPSFERALASLLASEIVHDRAR